jgi:nitrite reductase/ring-hydroxylating ferredoxin subunit
MGSLVEVSKTAEMKDGTMKAVSVGEHEILLARVGDKYYAADNRCPHMKGRLSQGKLEGAVVTCPLHGSQFDLSNGEVVRWLKGTGLLSKVGKTLKSPKPLTTYKVQIEDDRAMIEI